MYSDYAWPFPLTIITITQTLYINKNFTAKLIPSCLLRCLQGYLSVREYGIILYVGMTQKNKAARTVQLQMMSSNL